MCIKGWEINPTKIQEPSISVKFSGIQWCWSCRNIPSKVKDKLLHLAFPTTKREAHCIVGLFGLWRQHIPHSDPYTSSSESCYWRRLFNMPGLLCRLLYHLDHLIQKTQCYLRCQWQIGMLFGAFAGLYRWITEETFGLLQQGSISSAYNDPPFERQLLACCWAFMEIELWTVGHRVTIRPELPIMSWMFLTQQVMMQDMYSSNLLSNRSGIHVIMPEQVLKA